MFFLLNPLLKSVINAVRVNPEDNTMKAIDTFRQTDTSAENCIAAYTWADPFISPITDIRTLHCCLYAGGPDRCPA